MNIRLASMDKIRRFAAGRRSARVVEKRTYVLILVPFDFRGNGHAKKANVAQDLIDNDGHGNAGRTEALSTLTAADSIALRGAAKTTPERDPDDGPNLNCDLMWTWFLPNPHWPPKRVNKNALRQANR